MAQRPDAFQKKLAATNPPRRAGLGHARAEDFRMSVDNRASTRAFDYTAGRLSWAHCSRYRFLPPRRGCESASQGTAGCGLGDAGPPLGPRSPIRAHRPARHHPAGVGGFSGDSLCSCPVPLGRCIYRSRFRSPRLLARSRYRGRSALLQRLRVAVGHADAAQSLGALPAVPAHGLPAVPEPYPTAAMVPAR
jgi:hypothetical protein